MIRITPFLLLILLTVSSCTEFTPKPRGYMRIEPVSAQYTALDIDDLPYQFNISEQATVELPQSGTNEKWINIAYPSLHAKIYCSYIPITPATLQATEEEGRTLVLRQALQVTEIKEKEYENASSEVYGSLFELGGETVAPIQFMLTDSTTHFFRGALYYETRPNADSLAPVTAYLRKDIIELIQSFNWKK